jgi:hypothetical protein
VLSFNQFIVEKWVADLPKRGVSHPIYENPSSKDLIDLKKSGLTNDLVRFAAIAAKKKIYVWSGMDLIHDDALNKLVKEKIIPRVQHDNIEQALCGECRLLGGRLSFAQNDGMDTYFGALINTLKGRGKVDSSFLPLPYFEPSDLFDDLPAIIERYRLGEQIYRRI